MFELVTADLKKKKSNFVVVIITAGDHKPGSFAKSHLIFCLSVCLALSPSGNGISSVLSLQAWPSATGLRPHSSICCSRLSRAFQHRDAASEDEKLHEMKVILFHEDCGPCPRAVSAPGFMNTGLFFPP